MDDQENAQLHAEAEDDSLSIISSLRAEQKEATDEGSAVPATEPQESKSEETPTEPSTEELEQEAEARRNALLREIAIDPVLTNQYAQQQYYSSQQPQQYQPPQPQLEPQSPALPFDEFTFDANNPEHMKALMAAQIEEAGSPLFEKIDKIAQRFEKEEQQRQYQELRQVEDHANQKTVEFLDTYIPGFKGITDKVSKGENLNPIEKAVFNEAVNAESYFLQQYPNAVYDVQARAQIAQHIGPQLKEYAKALGLVAQPGVKTPQLTPEQKQVMSREMYVESSNAVPVSDAGSFEKAHKSGNLDQMIHALRQQK